jgi:antitoxin FitA
MHKINRRKLSFRLLTCVAHAISIMRMSKMIQLRNVPEALHRQLKARAALAGLPLSEYLIREARKLAEHPTPEEMRERLKGRTAYRGRMAASDLVRAERDSR